jgi:hypothetical protein
LIGSGAGQSWCLILGTVFVTAMIIDWIRFSLDCASIGTGTDGAWLPSFSMKWDSVSGDDSLPGSSEWAAG